MEKINKLEQLEQRINKLEELLLSNWELINFLNSKYGKFIGKDNKISLGDIRGMKTQRYIDDYNRKQNGKL